jgi:hypothetical protein
MMFDKETTAMLRNVLDELCENKYGSSIKTYVASKLLEAAAQGPATIDDLRDTGRVALRGVPRWV